MIKEKGVDFLVNAFNKFNLEYKNAKLLILGWNFKDNFIDDEYTIKLKKIIDKNENIKILGKIAYNDLVNYYSISDVQVVPSIWNEAFGLVLLEGMTCKLPIIASNVGGIPEVLHNTGIVIKKENLSENIYFNLCELYKSRDLRKKIGEEEFIISKNYDLKKYIDKIKERIINL